MTQGRIFRRARFTGKSESVEYSKRGTTHLPSKGTVRVQQV
jgi:hypothetical protein